MADNIDITPGSGKTVATDDVGGVQHQLIKVEFGLDGVATQVSASNPLPVANDIIRGFDGTTGRQIKTDGDGVLQVSEYTLGAGEDLSNNVLGVQTKPTVSALYSWLVGFKIYTSVSFNVKSAAGQLRKVRVNNKNAAERFLWILNQTAAPTNETTAVQIIPIAPSTSNLITFEFDDGGLNMATAISMGVSTSSTTFTAATAADHALLYSYL